MYDVISTRYYPDLQSRLAMNIGGENKPDALSVGCWRRFCEHTEVGFPLLRRTILDINTKLQIAVAHRAEQPLTPPHQELLAYISRHSGALVQRFEQQLAAGR